MRAFGELDIIHEEQIVDDRLNGYKVLVIGDVKLIPEDVAEHIINFVKNGGIVIADCVPQMNSYKQSLESMLHSFGVSSCIFQYYLSRRKLETISQSTGNAF